MIRSWAPWQIILLGFVLITLGMVIPFLIILKIIESTLFLNFLAFTASMAGMMIGFIGMVLIIKTKQK